MSIEASTILIHHQTQKGLTKSGAEFFILRVFTSGGVCFGEEWVAGVDFASPHFQSADNLRLIGALGRIPTNSLISRYTMDWYKAEPIMLQEISLGRLRLRLYCV